MGAVVSNLERRAENFGQLDLGDQVPDIRQLRSACRVNAPRPVAFGVAPRAKNTDAIRILDAGMQSAFDETGDRRGAFAQNTPVVENLHGRRALPGLNAHNKNRLKHGRAFLGTNWGNCHA